MQTTLALREKAAQLLAADAATLAPAMDANHMVLIKNEFTSSEATAIGSLEFADFDGSTPVAVGTGTQPEGLDPNTSDAIINLKPPAGGFRWETTGVTNLPQTVYGFALTDNAGTTLLATERLQTPILLTAVNQVVNLPVPTIRQLAGTMV